MAHKRIRVERQGEGECLLAAIAAVEGVSLGEMRERALEGTGCDTWAEIVYGSDDSRFWDRVRVIAPWATSCHEVLRANVVGGSGEHDYTPDTAPALPSGRGAVYLYGMFLAHACAYEDGLMYDPEDHTDPNRGQTVAEYMRSHHSRGCKVFIVPKEGKA